MWPTFLALSVVCFLLSVVFFLTISSIKAVRKSKCKPFNFLIAGVFVTASLMFIPTNMDAGMSLIGIIKAVFLSVVNATQTFAFGCEFGNVAQKMTTCPQELIPVYQFWISLIYVIAPVFTFGVVLSLFRNVSAYLRYWRGYFKDAYIFSELNEKSFVLAADIQSKRKAAMIVFTDVQEDTEQKHHELLEKAKEMDAICFKKNVAAVNFKKHAQGRPISFFAIGEDETKNLNQSLQLIDNYRERENTHIYIFSIKTESELLLTAVDKGKIKVRRINEVQALVNRILYERGDMIFDSAREDGSDEKRISAVVVGMGNHGTEMVKALSWYGQMDGYQLQINAFDKDPLAEEKFIALAPELMSPDYNGVRVAGEAQYAITVQPSVDVQTSTFADKISKITDATYVFVALGNDDVNINTAVNLRMYFERMHIHPVIQAVVYNTQQKKALKGIENYRGQAYDIEFVGDIASSYTEDVILNSELEADALRRHMKWGKEAEFWTYEYNYRSSMASAIHMKARIACGIPGAGKKEEELTAEERDTIEVLEHRRWNAYMRSEGYVYSGSKDKSSRNDLAKMHHDLVEFASLSEEEKRKDSRVGTN